MRGHQRIVRGQGGSSGLQALPRAIVALPRFGELGAERERADGALAGVTLFSNSFGQPSTYVFPWGKVYRDVMGYPGVFAKWTAGLLYGYKSPYENKVPLNHDGYSPGFIPAVGWESSRFQAQLNFLGNAGVMYQMSWKLSP